MNTAPGEQRFQFHLSTAFMAMLLTGALLGANLTPSYSVLPRGQVHQRQGWPLPVCEGAQGAAYIDGTGVICLILNIAFALGSIAILTAGSEWWIRWSEPAGIAAAAAADRAGDTLHRLLRAREIAQAETGGPARAETAAPPPSGARRWYRLRPTTWSVLLALALTLGWANSGHNVLSSEFAILRAEQDFGWPLTAVTRSARYVAQPADPFAQLSSVPYSIAQKAVMVDILAALAVLLLAAFICEGWSRRESY